MWFAGRSFSRVIVSVGLLTIGGGTRAGDDARWREKLENSCAPMPTPQRFVPGPPMNTPDDALRVNHLQAKATHNSYHVKPLLPIGAWGYTRAPLAEQLEREGVRGVELDVHWDDDCGRFRVFHIGFLDSRTTCALFTDCLVALRDWSAAHPGHHPIFVQIEPKFNESESGAAARMETLEHEIASVFDPRWLLVPDELKGSEASVAAGIAAHGWPTLAETRGRFVFYLDDDSDLRDAYTHRRHDLDGRLLFARGRVDEPFVAMQISNDPIDDRADITAALAKDLIVRTRADSPSSARDGDVAQREAALASGAQIISTDFPVPVDDVPYVLRVPGGTPSRCAPGVAPGGCTPLAIEDPESLRR
jgi:hypothetical protein